MDLDNENPGEGILSSTISAIRSTTHPSTQHTPLQLVIGRDSILNINQEANWQFIKQSKQALINKGNQNEICHRQSVSYWGQSLIKERAACIGPYTLT